MNAVISPHPELTELVRSFGKTELYEIPNMIDFDKFCQTNNGESVKKEFGIEEEMVVSYVARLVEWKDPLTFIKTIPYVKEKISNVKFLLVGGGPLEKELRELAMKMNVHRPSSFPEVLSRMQHGPSHRVHQGYG